MRQLFLFRMTANICQVLFRDFIRLKTYEIAEKVGYANSGYFSKLFKQKFHVSPYEFRNMQEEQ